MVVEVKELCKSYTRPLNTKGKGRQARRKEEFLAVDHVSFAANEGEILGILGPNGAGKTTLLRMLGGIITPTAGSLSVCGQQLATNPNAVKAKLGYISGNTRLYGKLTPREILRVFGELYSMDAEKIAAATARIADILELHSFLDSRIENLSTGQTQRAGIARCLIHSPQIYIFDEPTNGLDVLSGKAIVDFMLQERQSGKTVLYSTHYMEEAETLCDRIVMLHHGRVLATGTPAELREQWGVSSLRELFFAMAEKEGGIDADSYH